MSQIDLSALLAPLSPDEFFASYWPDQYHCSHGSIDRLGPLADIEELFDLPKLLERYEGPVAVYYPPDRAEREQSTGIKVHPREALAYYESGSRLQINAVQNYVPAVGAYLNALEHTLGIGSRSTSCGLFATPPGGVVLPHLDTDPAFSVQLKGTKIWRFCTTPTIPNVLHNHIYGTKSWLIEQYYEGAIPDAMPDDALELAMQPGSVLFLPRGLPHTTTSRDETISITLEMPQPTYIDLITEALRDELSQVEAFRAFVLVRDEAQRQRSLAALDDLRPALRELFQRLERQPERILAQVTSRLLPGVRRWYRRSELATVELQIEHGTSSHVRVSHPGLGRSEIEIPGSLVSLCEWVLAREDRFMDLDTLVAAPHAVGVDVIQVLTALVETGVLEEVAGDDPRASASAGAPA